MSSWSSTLPELGSLSPEAVDPTRIEEAVREGYEAGHAAGREDGWASGYADGHARGYAEARASLDEERERLRRRLAAAVATVDAELGKLAEAEAAVRAAFEAAALDAALQIAEAVLRRELAVCRDPGRDALRRAFSVAPTRAVEDAAARLHPDDVAVLGDVSDLVPGVRVTVVADPEVEPGGCLLQLGDTSIDASLRAALERVREELAGR